MPGWPVPAAHCDRRGVPARAAFAVAARVIPAAADLAYRPAVLVEPGRRPGLAAAGAGPGQLPGAAPLAYPAAVTAEQRPAGPPADRARRDGQAAEPRPISSVASRPATGGAPAVSAAGSAASASASCRRACPPGATTSTAASITAAGSDGSAADTAATTVSRRQRGHARPPGGQASSCPDGQRAATALSAGSAGHPGTHRPGQRPAVRGGRSGDSPAASAGTGDGFDEVTGPAVQGCRTARPAWPGSAAPGRR